MENADTMHLLQECDAGTQMAVSSLDEVLDHVVDSKMKDLLTESKKHHDKLKTDIEDLLKECNTPEKDPNPIAKGMSWMKTNVKLGMNNNDATVAELIIDGCDMGIKSLSKYSSQYKMANKSSKDICSRLISIEEELGKKLREYL